MALIKDYLTRKWIYENHPSMAAETCLNTVQTKRQCSVCQEACPHGVFRGETPDWDLCDGCGVCAARCPSRCLRPAALLSQNILELCRRIQGNVTFSCGEQDMPADLTAPCLAAIPWELIALFALEGTVALHMIGCKNCSRAGLLCHFERTLDEVRRFLGDEKFQRSVVCRRDAAAPAPVAERGFSRRDSFALLFSKSRAAVTSLLPEDRELSPDGMLCRRLLVHKLRSLEQPVQNLSLAIPAFLDSCTACGLCTKICPTQALHRITEGPQAGTWYMALIPWRCTGCGLCADCCPSGGLSAPEWRMQANILTPVLHAVAAAPCPRCGEPLEPGQSAGLCARCQAESAPPLVW